MQNNLYYNKHRNGLLIGKSDYNKLSNFNKYQKSLKSICFDNHEIYFLSPYWFLHSLKEIYIEEVYKFNADKEEPVIIDCGANIGLSILYFKNLYQKAKIIAFEPDPHIMTLLKKNIAVYQYDDVKLINAAVWTEETNILFYSEGSVGGKIDFNASTKSNQVEVPTIRLKDYLHSKVDFLKIDIEGAEYDVLKDCRELLNNVEHLFIEYHVERDKPQYLHEILEWVNAAGFIYYIREAQNNMSYPFLKSYDDYYQMQLNVFCYRIN